MLDRPWWAEAAENSEMGVFSGPKAWRRVWVLAVLLRGDQSLLPAARRGLGKLG